MKLNLLLSLGIAVNIVIGATLPSQYLPFTNSIANAASSLYASPISTNILFPRESGCGFRAASLTIEDRNCGERNGYFIDDIVREVAGGPCLYKYICFLPSGEKKIRPDAIKAQDPSECIEIRGKYYCSADLNNVCPDCTFPQLVERVKMIFPRFFQYNSIDVTKITTPIELPTDTDEKIKCPSQVIYSGRELYCRYRSGYFIKMSLYPDCDKEYFACLLQNNKKISKNGVVAQNLSECVIVNDMELVFNHIKPEYCSVDFTNIPCSKGKECTFTELIQEIGNTFGDYFSYEKSNSTSREAISIPEKEFCNVHFSTYYKQENNCETRNGVIISGYLVDDDSNCDYKYACFLPSGNERLLPDAFEAQDPSECIVINDRYYCSADLNNIECSDCTTFPQFVEKVKDILEYSFEKVDVSKLTEPILLPKDVPSKNVECVERQDTPQTPFYDCEEKYGRFFNMEFYPDCEKTYYTCFIPQNIEPEESAIIAQDLSECIKIAGTIYCAADYYGGVTCPEGKENCTFSEFVQEMVRIYGDYFDYEPYIPEDTSEIITETITDYVTDFTTDFINDIY